MTPPTMHDQLRGGSGEPRPALDETQATVHFRPRRRWSRRTVPTSIGLSVAPMIDMSFTFLIFFVATTRFERPEGTLSSPMPRDTGVQTGVALPLTPIVVRLSATGPGPDDFTVRVDRFEPAPAGLAELPAFLRHIQGQPGFDQETPVVLVAGDEVRWDHVVSTWNAALRAEYRNIAFAQP